MEPRTTPPSPSAQPRTVQPKKSSGSGCLIFALVGAGIVFVLLVVGGVAAWRYARTEKGKAVVGALGEAIKMAGEGAKAPGTAELRKAGCKQAIVMDMRRAMKLGEAFAKLDDKGTPPSGSDLPTETMVICTAGFMGTTPECDAVATTYVGALGGAAAGPFFALVNKQGGRGFHCMVLYSKEGARLREVRPPGQHPSTEERQPQGQEQDEAEQDPPAAKGAPLKPL